MKKFIALAIAVLMIAALAVPAFADDCTVKYSVDEAYTLVVPAELTVSANGGETLTVALEDVNVVDAKTVSVAGTFALGEKAFKLGDLEAAGVVIDAATEDATADLAFAWVDGAPTKAGSYQTVLTFTVA